MALSSGCLHHYKSVIDKVYMYSKSVFERKLVPGTTTGANDLIGLWKNDVD